MVAQCYPVTLIYYPKQQDPDTFTERSWSIALGDSEPLSQKITHEESLIPGSPEGVPPELPVATETVANTEASHGHKRTISAVTSRAEREREEAAEAGKAAQEANGNDINIGNPTEITGGTVRRSGRASKPSKRWWGNTIAVEVFNNLDIS
jgi:hypothetical protein